MFESLGRNLFFQEISVIEILFAMEKFPAASLVMRGSPLGSSEVDCLRRLQPNDLLRNDTVDGSEIREAHQLRLVVYLLLKKKQG